MVGQLENFNLNYSGNLNLYSGEFFLKTKQGEFNSESLDIEIIDFNGSIFFENRSIVLEGNSNLINFGKNNIILAGEEFRLISIKKTNLDLYFDEVKLDFDEGVIKLGSQLNHEFENTSITLNNFNSSFAYDGTFSITGICDNLILETSKPKLKIYYESES